jgi:hypothetical protein
VRGDSENHIRLRQCVATERRHKENGWRSLQVTSCFRRGCAVLGSLQLCLVPPALGQRTWESSLGVTHRSIPDHGKTNQAEKNVVLPAVRCILAAQKAIPAQDSVWMCQTQNARLCFGEKGGYVIRRLGRSIQRVWSRESKYVERGQQSLVNLRIDRLVQRSKSVVELFSAMFCDNVCVCSHGLRWPKKSWIDPL